MSFLGFTVSSGLRAYDTFPSAILTVVEDWGWSLLPQFPGSVRPGEGSSSPAPEPQPVEYLPPVLPPISVGQETGSTGQAARVYPVFTRPEPARPVEVPRAVVIVEDVATEVEQHPEGDFPAGSIFAPGRAWEGEAHTLDEATPDEEEGDMAHDWGHLLRQGVAEWGGIQQQPAFNAMGPAFVATGAATTIPGGRAALPPSSAAVTSYANGDACGNRRYVTLDRETGKITCKRRRRRRLLTNRDLADLASLKTITGGGAALNAAVIRAVR